MWIYILTFALGLLVDQLNRKEYSIIRLLFIVWLYIFLCFSYTNGSDWRSYELGYEDGYITYALLGRDLGFVAIMNAFRLVIDDFWLTFGILKCVYLFSCIKVVQKFTSHWLMVISMMMPLSLLYMLIDNPLRFMVAMTFVNFAILCLINSKYVFAIVLSIIALSCHSASLFCVIFLPALRFDLFSKFKSSTLIVIYLFLLVLSSSLEYVLQLQGVMSNILENYFGREGLMNNYEAENTESLFTIGTLVNLVLFCVILKNRDSLIKNNKYVFSSSILYFYVYNITHVLPIGHRIRMAFTFYCCISLVLIMLKEKKYRIVLATLFCAMLMKNIWVTYSYLPYTNSISYIITTHKPYQERSNLNLINYKERTGRDHFVE